MIVKELIKLLEVLDQDKEICTNNYSEYGYSVSDICDVVSFDNLAEYEQNDVMSNNKLSIEQTNFYVIE